jgi:hypothetical protein
MDTPAEAEIQKKFHGAPDDWLQKAEASMPMGQLVKPDQLAILAAYMLSPHSGVMTGALVDYDQNVAAWSGNGALGRGAASMLEDPAPSRRSGRSRVLGRSGRS